MSDQFEKFWTTWPRSVRKGGKSVCLARWKKGMYDCCADQIIKHVAWMCTTDAWRKSDGAFIPAPLVYLNQQRWDGAEIPDSFDKPVVNTVLQKLQEDTQKAAPIPEDIKKRLAALRKPL